MADPETKTEAAMPVEAAASIVRHCEQRLASARTLLARADAEFESANRAFLDAEKDLRAAVRAVVERVA